MLGKYFISRQNSKESPDDITQENLLFLSKIEWTQEFEKESGTEILIDLVGFKQIELHLVTTVMGKAKQFTGQSLRIQIQFICRI